MDGDFRDRHDDSRPLAANVTTRYRRLLRRQRYHNRYRKAVVSAAVHGSGATLTVGASNNAGIFTWSGVTAGTRYEVGHDVCLLVGQRLP